MNPLLAYVGPESFLPLTSILAAIVGFLLTMGKSSLSLVVGLLRRSDVRNEIVNNND
jgi:hypothetical protein